MKISRTGKENVLISIRKSWPKKKTMGIQNKIIFDRDAIVLLEPRKSEDSYIGP